MLCRDDEVLSNLDSTSSITGFTSNALRTGRHLINYSTLNSVYKCCFEGYIGCQIVGLGHSDSTEL